jgi:cell wall assembly regulator SMI1
MTVYFEQPDDHRPATEQDVTHLEMALAAVLPADYREFLLQHNGGYPKPSGFCDGQEVVDSFFGFCEKGNCLWCNYYMTRAVIPADVIPIAGDPLGNYICLAVKKPRAGKVFFWDHEAGESGGLSELAESFSAFLDSMCELPPDIDDEIDDD